MKLTSSQAAKLMRQLNDELAAIRKREDSSNTFLAALGEDLESARPEYSYDESQAKQRELELKIRKLKHALNVFNATTVIPEYGITIDEMLVLLPQLSYSLSRLSRMKDALPKARESTPLSRSGNVIDYRYANYDIKQAEADYKKTSDELAKAQTALDLVNNTVEFEADF